MRHIVLITLISLPLFSTFFPQTIHTSISTVSDKSVSLKQSFPINGMSGVVIHDYGNELKAITGRVVQYASRDIKLIESDIIHHDELPTINTAIKAGDKVIGGYLYNSILLLAPDAQTYAKITSMHKKRWVHPDLFALFLSKEGDARPSKENLASFAKSYQIGLIYIVGNGTAKLLDPISGEYVGQKTISGLPAKGNAPFFMRFDEIDAGWFSEEVTENYYKLMDAI
ncbi:MAG: hypothetical protein COA92_03355 [Sulfurovum sp.]|nr:MAG: hypothetical protein COA92_03355 [Sulfurovum sp.]